MKATFTLAPIERPSGIEMGFKNPEAQRAWDSETTRQRLVKERYTRRGDYRFPYDVSEYWWDHNDEARERNKRKEAMQRIRLLEKGVLPENVSNVGEFGYNEYGEIDVVKATLFTIFLLVITFVSLASA